MSIRNLTQPNNTKLYVNTAENGININGTIVKNQQEDNNYTYVLPEKPTVEGQPQVMVSTLTGDTVDTTWVSAGGGVIPIPDPLVIDELQSQNIINDDNIQTDTLNSNTITNTGLITSNIIINNNYIQSPELTTSALYFKSLTTYDPIRNCSFIFNGGNNITYVLPSSSLPEGEERVMTATRNGNFTNMNWNNPVTSVPLGPKSYRKQIDANWIIKGGLSNSFFNVFTLDKTVDVYYQLIIKPNVSKTQGTTWNNYIVISSNENIELTSNATNYFRIETNSIGQPFTLCFSHIIKITNTSPLLTTAEFKVTFVSEAGGGLLDGEFRLLTYEVMMFPITSVYSFLT